MFTASFLALLLKDVIIVVKWFFSCAVSNGNWTSWTDGAENKVELEIFFKKISSYLKKTFTKQIFKKKKFIEKYLC